MLERAEMLLGAETAELDAAVLKAQAAVASNDALARGLNRLAVDLVAAEQRVAMLEERLAAGRRQVRADAVAGWHAAVGQARLVVDATYDKAVLREEALYSDLLGAAGGEGGEDGWAMDRYYSGTW